MYVINISVGLGDICCCMQVLAAADKIDAVGNKEARKEVAMIKVYVPRAIGRVADRALQVHGALGLSEDSFLAHAVAGMRCLRIADGMC